MCTQRRSFVRPRLRREFNINCILQKQSGKRGLSPPGPQLGPVAAPRDSA
jgi:hypothetical protein